MNTRFRFCIGLTFLAALLGGVPAVVIAAPAGARPSDASDDKTSADDAPQSDAPAASKQPATRPPAQKKPTPSDAAAQPNAGGIKPGNPPGPPDPMSATYIEIALTELRKEFILSTKGGEKNPLRPQSTWFIDHPANLDQKLLLETMAKPMSPDPRMSAYIRWQLLSGLSKKIAPAAMPAALELYHKAPVPAPRYGITANDQKKLDSMLTTAKKDEYVRLADKVQEQVARGADQNRLFLAYRDELYARLQPGFDTFTAAMGDAVERLEMGWLPKDHMKRVCEDLAAWATSDDARPRQCAALAEFVYKLRSERSPKYYVSVGVRVEKPYWAWRTEAVYDAKKLQSLQQLLEEAAQPKAAARAGAGGK